jgi:hypothetical protein
MTILIEMKSKPHELTNKLIPWSRFLLETITVTQLVKKFPAFYGNLIPCRIHNSSPLIPILSQMHPVHTFQSHFPKIQPNILPSHLHLGLQSGLFPSGDQSIECISYLSMDTTP